MFHYIRLERHISGKHSSLSGPFIRCNENEVLWILPLVWFEMKHHFKLNNWSYWGTTTLNRMALWTECSRCHGLFCRMSLCFVSFCCVLLCWGSLCGVSFYWVLWCLVSFCFVLLCWGSFCGVSFYSFIVWSVVLLSVIVWSGIVLSVIYSGCCGACACIIRIYRSPNFD